MRNTFHNDSVLEVLDRNCKLKYQAKDFTFLNFGGVAQLQSDSRIFNFLYISL